MCSSWNTNQYHLLTIQTDEVCMKQVYLIIGTPGSGKTWVCKQLEDRFDYLAHDDFPDDKSYVAAVKRLEDIADKPILIETPFSVSNVMGPLVDHGMAVTPVFIIETAEITMLRYAQREGKAIIKGHLTRIETYKKRAVELSAFSGTSQEVLEHMKKI